MTARQLLEEYKFSSELHAHSMPASRCGKFYANEVVDIYHGVGCNTLTLTNHLTEKHLIERTEAQLAEFYLSDYYKACKQAKKVGMNVAFGVEIRFAGSYNEFLVYGICPDDMEKLIHYIRTDIATFYREFKNDKNVIIHAHPYRERSEPIAVGHIDGIETFNCHPGHNSQIAYACRLARDNGLLVTGGSDFHEEGRHATCLMRTKWELKNSYDIAEAIKSKDFVLDVFGHIVLPYLY